MENKDFNALVRSERLDYFNKWRALNKDKVKNYNRNYWIKRTLKKIKDN